MPHADVVTTTTHKTLRGPRGGLILCKAEHAKAIDKAIFPGMQGGPLEHVIAAKAVAFERGAGAVVHEYCAPGGRQRARARRRRSWSAASSSCPAAPTTTSCWSTCAIESLTGKVAEQALDAAGITVNKNTVPGETQSPFVTSGIRIGTPAVTTRGMGEAEMRTIATLIDEVLRAPNDASVAQRVKGRVRELAGAFPLYRATAGITGR